MRALLGPWQLGLGLTENKNCLTLGKGLSEVGIIYEEKKLEVKILIGLSLSCYVQKICCWTPWEQHVAPRAPMPGGQANPRLPPEHVRRPSAVCEHILPSHWPEDDKM